MRRFIHISLLQLVFTLASFAYVPAQYGSPLFHTFGTEDYHAAGQNFDVAVDSRNIVYVANAGGVLEYDGTRWRKIPGTDASIPFAVGVDESDHVWVGMRSDMGVLLPDTSGTLRFFSILPMIEDSLEFTTGVWRVRPTPDGIFFVSPQFLLRWVFDKENPLEGQATVWPSYEHTYTMGCYIDDTFYVRKHRSPIQYIDGDSLQVVPQWSHQSRQSFDHAARFDDTRILFSTFRGQVYLGDEKGIEPIDGPINQIDDEILCFGSIPIGSDHFVMSSSKGLIVFDKSGNILEVIENLGENTTRAVSREGVPDRNGGYWFPMDIGVVRIELDRPMRILDKKNGTEGVPFRVLQFNDRLHIATSTGVYYLEEAAPFQTPMLKAIENVNVAVYNMLVQDDRLFLSSSRGLYYVDTNEVAHHVGSFLGNSINITMHGDQKHLILASELQGIVTYEIQKDSVVEISLVETDYKAYDYLDFDHEDNLWAMVQLENESILCRSPYSTSAPSKFQFEPYGADRGLHGKIVCPPFMWRDSFRVLTVDGLLTYDSANDRFVDTMVPFPMDLTHASSFHSPLVDHLDRLYLSVGSSETYRVSLDPSNGQQVEQLLKRSPIRPIISFYRDPHSGMMLYGADDGRIITTYDTAPNFPSNTLLRGVTIGDNSIPIEKDWDNQKKANTQQGPVSTIRFLYTLTSYDVPEQNEFQYRLVGRSDDWSEWSGETYHDFNDLREGDYQFEVRGRDYLGNVSASATYSFKVLPPWYRTLWMQTIWVLLVLGAMYLIIKMRTRQLARQQLRLEALVRQRTKELQESQKTEIREIEARKAAEFETNRLKTVAQLATTIAHELNNPLAVIQGRIEVAEINHDVDPSLQTVHKSIRLQVNRMSSLVEKLCGIESIRVVDYAGGIKMLDLKPTDAENSDCETSDGEEASPSS